MASIDRSLHDIARPQPDSPLHPLASQWKDLRRDVVLLYDDRVPIGGSRRNFAHPFFNLWLLRVGSLSLESPAGEVSRVESGSWVLIPPGYQHSQTFSSEAHLLSVHFRAEWASGMSIFRLDSPLTVPGSAWADVERELLVLLDMRLEGDGPVPLRRYAEADAVLLSFLSTWYERMVELGHYPVGPAALDPRVRRAAEYLDTIEYTGSVPYHRLTSDNAISRTHLDRLFKEQLGKSPRQYLESRVLQRVIRDLSATNKTVTEICFDHGFVSAAHFCRWFRRSMGRSPHEYRAAVLRQASRGQSEG